MTQENGRPGRMTDVKEVAWTDKDREKPPAPDAQDTRSTRGKFSPELTLITDMDSHNKI